VTTITRWLADLPAVALYVGMAAAWIALTFAIEAVLRRRVQGTRREQTGRSVAIMLGVLANIYAVLVAFVVVQSWSNLQDAQATVDSEAATLAQIYDNSQTLAAPQDAAVRRAVYAYDRAVVGPEWRQMERHGNSSPVASAALENLFRSVQRAEPRSQVQHIFYDQTATHLDDLVMDRRQRLTASEGALPWPIYLLVIAGGVAVIGFACVLETTDRRAHLAVVAVLAVVIAFLFALVVSLDHPFTGHLSVSRAAFHQGNLAGAFAKGG
jgi:hypothetical protein